MSFNTIQEVKDYIENKVKEHLWDKDAIIAYSNRMSRALGKCSYHRYHDTFKLTFNIKFIEQYYKNSNEVELTVAHEIAHALVGNHHHHDYIWKQACIKLGGTGDRIHKGIYLTK